MVPKSFFRRSSVLFLLGSGLALAACGGGDSAPADTLPAGLDFTVTNVPSLRFDAADYTAPAGEISVGFANEDSVRHSLIIAQDGTKIPNFKLVTGKKGDAVVGTIKLDAGVYQLLCDVPGHQNMKATLTVS